VSGAGEGGVVAATGLALEARIAAGSGVVAVAGGMNAPMFERALEREAARGAAGIISFGIAGALAEELAPGTWIVARGVHTRDRYRPCDAAWVEALAMRLPGARVADIAACDQPLADSMAKHALHAATSAVAVDTESHVASAVAAVHSLPFAAFRVIADPARRSLPPAACVGVKTGGTIDVAAVMRSLARLPSQGPLLLRTAVDARAAFAALRRGRRLLGPRLAFDLRALERDVL
jgi:adenosylhomocysteine nucleosidase